MVSRRPPPPPPLAFTPERLTGMYAVVWCILVVMQFSDLGIGTLTRGAAVFYTIHQRVQCEALGDYGSTQNMQSVTRTILLKCTKHLKQCCPQKFMTTLYVVNLFTITAYSMPLLPITYMSCILCALLLMDTSDLRLMEDNVTIH